MAGYGGRHGVVAMAVDEPRKACQALLRRLLWVEVPMSRYIGEMN